MTELIDAFCRLRIEPTVRWELIVVDNASNDGTPEVLSSEVSRGRLPLVHLTEPLAGKTRALNRALRIARGELIVFTDDDVIPEKNWLMAFHEASKSNPTVMGFGGRVLPLWQSPPPRWMSNGKNLTVPDALVNIRDHGNEAVLLPPLSLPAGCNAALRQCAIERAGIFRLDLGPGTRFPYAEDTEYFLRLSKAGERFLYVPGALIHHINPGIRMTRSYALRWVYHCARSEVQIADFSGVKKTMNIPRYLYRQLLERIFLLMMTYHNKERFNSLQRLVRCAGEIIGHIQKTK